ncbi:C40 family peptidase [Saccharibacillus sp. CPCC 101409]|uniref:C40 family peptidase n=1 Tax=Saccharibacillus sp. CPCC 101409 TaxID=3058041 RepID=UPI0026717057|nr:C40 family peptidase [Saccharibacillus sp. CPCC 101409]MDO3413148.1 C40 family peptidase [Saccharibacillus sp. CPCC 101409]
MKKKLTAAVMGLAIAFSVAATGNAHADSKLDNVIDSALGTPYRTAGTSLNGFDCSGFTSYVFDKLGIDLPRQSSSQYSAGSKIDKSDLRAGDLVFFNTNGRGISHVGIYVGNGKFAHASSSNGVRYDSLSSSYYADRYVGASRYMSTYTYNTVAND